MLFNGRRRRIRRSEAAALAVVVVVGLCVAVPHAARAAAEDDFVTVTPTGVIKPSGSDGPDFDVRAQLLGGPVHITLSVNGFARFTYDLTGSGAGPYDMQVPAANFTCADDNTVRVDTDYGGAFPGQTQTVGDLVVICPQITVSPPEVSDKDSTTMTPVTITLPRRDGFDTLGPDQGPKSLYVGARLVGTFGYRVTPQATFTPDRCGDYAVELTQPSPFGPVRATATFTEWCTSLWDVDPHGVNAPHGETGFTVKSDEDFPNVGPARVYIDDATTPIGTISPTTDPDGHQHWSATFSDNSVFVGTAGPHHIRVEIDHEVVGEVHFADVDLDLATSTYEIPFYVLDPSIDIGHREIDQSALPYDEPLFMHGFDGTDDAYDARHLAPRAVFVDGEQIASVPDEDSTHVVVNPPCGENTLRVTQETGFGSASAETALTVLCPAVTADPAVITKESEPRSITVDGTGFHDTQAGFGRQPYVVTLDGTQVGQGETDGSGALTDVITASGLACGSHQITVTEQAPIDEGGGFYENGLLAAVPTGRTESPNGTASPSVPTDPGAPTDPADPDGPLTVSTPLVVNCPVDGRPGSGHGRPHGSPDTTLNVQPQVIIAGMTTLVTGTGFTPGRRVSLAWVLPGGVKETACERTATADKDGTFLLLCVVPQHDRIGQRTLTATDGARTAPAGALVIIGPMQPSGRSRNPRLVIRH